MKRKSFRSVAAVAVLAFAAAACADDGPDVPGAAAPFAASGEGAAALADLQPGDTVEFVASEFAFGPSDLTAEPGTYAGVLINDGTIEHDITFDNGEAVVAAPGESVEFEFVVPQEGVAFGCTKPGHADAGMHGMVHTPA